MKNFDINKAENTQLTLDTAKGLVDAINDLVESKTLLFTEYPGANQGKNFQANRLYSQLLSLSCASINTIEQAQNQLNSIVDDYYKGGEK